MLVFQFGTTVQSVACIGRASADTENAQTTQRAVSIVYAALISMIALLMGVAILVFGFKIEKRMQEAPANSTAKDNSVRATKAFVVQQ